MGRKAVYQPSRCRRCGGTNHADDQKSGESFRMRPDYNDVAKSIRPIKPEQEERAHET
jgi:hypothetical protein